MLQLVGICCDIFLYFKKLYQLVLNVVVVLRLFVISLWLCVSLCCFLFFFVVVLNHLVPMLFLFVVIVFFFIVSMSVCYILHNGLQSIYAK